MPVAKPTALKVVTAGGRDVVGHRRVNSAEPKPEQITKAPEPPERFNDNEKAQYTRLAEMFIGMRVLTRADEVALEKLAWELSLLRQMEAQLNSENICTINAKTLVPHANPEVRIYLELGASVDRALRQFGGTPASRATVKVDRSKDAKDDWSEL